MSQVSAHINQCVNKQAPKREGVCVVLGAAPCWEEDLIEFGKVHKKFEVCGVNYASTLVECEMLATCHGDLVTDMLNAYSMAHNTNDLPELHVRYNSEESAVEQDHYAWDIRTVCGSAPFAAAAMVLCGYDLVVMCGCPITGYGGYALKGHGVPPAWSGKRPTLAKSRQNYMKKFCERYPKIAGKIRSMSGATQEIYGGL